MTDQPETFHACPPDGSGLTPCCGRTPFELPRGDRISSETVTCTGPAPAPADLREQYAETVRNLLLERYDGDLSETFDAAVNDIADAVLAVRDRELEQARAEVAELRDSRTQEEADRYYLQALYGLHAALGIELTSDQHAAIDTFRDACMATRDRTCNRLLTEYRRRLAALNPREQP